MNIAGLSKNEWQKKYEMLRTVLAFSVVVSVVLAIAAASPLAFVERSTAKQVLAVILIVWAVVQVFIFALTAFYLTSGRKLYRAYARRIIDYNDSDPIKKIVVTCEKITLFFDENGVVQKEDLNYMDYDIKVVMREDYDKPVFYRRDGFIYKLILPYVEDASTARWDEYSVKPIKRRS